MATASVRRAHAWRTAGEGVVVGGDVTHGRDLRGEEGDLLVGYVAAGLDLNDLDEVGSIETSSNGQVIEGLNVTGRIRVDHDDVSIRGCFIHNDNTGTPIDVRGTASNLFVEYVEIHLDLLLGGERNGINFALNTPQAGSRHHVRRANIHDVGDGIRARGGVLVEEVKIRIGPNQRIVDGIPYHADALHAQSGAAIWDPAIEVVRSYLEGGMGFGNSALYFTPISGDFYNLRVKDNLVLHTNKELFWNGGHGSATGAFLGTSEITGNDLVLDWLAPGQPTAHRIGLVEAGTVIRSGNRLVDVDGNYLGSAD